MKHVAWIGLLALLLTAGAEQARAQQSVDEAIFRRGTTRHGDRFGDRYRKFRVRIEGGPWIEAKPAVEVWLKLHSNTKANRIQLPNAELAIKWAATHRKSQHTIVEVRGSQVVWVKGNADRDPTEHPSLGEALLRDAWEDTAKYFTQQPTEVHYRGLLGNTGMLLSFKRQFGARFKLPQNATPDLKQWVEDLVAAAERAGAAVERRADGNYRYVTHSVLDSTTIALPPPSGGMAGSLGGQNP